jgi:predicted acyl esterase
VPRSMTTVFTTPGRRCTASYTEGVPVCFRFVRARVRFHRGRYRKSFEKPEPIEPEKRLGYQWSLHTQNYTFKKGHRIMVQVQSTWFPVIDRNPQTFVKNIFEAKESDFRPATHKVLYTSHVTLPVVKAAKKD